MSQMKQNVGGKENFSAFNSSFDNGVSLSSGSSQYNNSSKLPKVHCISFMENGMVDGCQWVLMYNTLMYGNYLVPNNLVEGPALNEMVKSNHAVVVLEKFLLFIVSSRLRR